MATRGERWAFWLEAELDRRGWSRSDLAKRSAKKSNGRPIIDAPRVSEWLNKNESPRDPDILSELARILGVRTAVVLNAAGWLPDHELEGTAPPATEGEQEDSGELLDLSPLIEEAKTHLLNQYDLLRRLPPAKPSVASTSQRERQVQPPPERPLRAVARQRRRRRDDQ